MLSRANSYLHTVAKPNLWVGIAVNAFYLPLKEGKVLSSVKKLWYPLFLEDQEKKGLSFQLLHVSLKVRRLQFLCSLAECPNEKHTSLKNSTQI